MTAEKNPKQGDVYLTWNQLVEMLHVSKQNIYRLYDQHKLRYVFKKIPWCDTSCNMIHFNLDDVRENLKKSVYE